MADQGWEQVAAEAEREAGPQCIGANVVFVERDLLLRLAAIVRQQAAEVARLREGMVEAADAAHLAGAEQIAAQWAAMHPEDFVSGLNGEGEHETT